MWLCCVYISLQAKQWTKFSHEIGPHVFLLKNPLNKSGDIPLFMWEILSEAQQVKREKDKMAKGPSMDAQTLGRFWQLHYHMNFIS